MMRWLIRLLYVAYVIILSAGLVLAHGVNIEHTLDPVTGEISIRAAFDTGEALDGAQVAVFAPSDLATPWLTGSTDADGTFKFLPDYQIPGIWDIQVRKAGHGGLISIPLDAETMPRSSVDEVALDGQTISLESTAQIIITGDARFEVQGNVIVSAQGQEWDSASAEFTLPQILIMVISITWGFIGTALYFKQRQMGKT